jgi:hypothetical protein
VKVFSSSLESAEMGLNINEITESVIGAAIAVHRELGPGLLESAYEACLAYELSERKLKGKRVFPSSTAVFIWIVGIDWTSLWKIRSLLR